MHLNVIKDSKKKLVLFILIGLYSVKIFAQTTASSAEIQGFLEGAFGYRPDRGGVEGNRKYYADLGYTFSYKIPDSTVYTYIGISVFLLAIIIFIITKINSDKPNNIHNTNLPR